MLGVRGFGGRMRRVYGVVETIDVFDTSVLQ